LIDKHYKRLRVNAKVNPARFSQFLVFKKVSTEILGELDNGFFLDHLRIYHNPKSKILVTKIMPSITHEAAHRQLGREIERSVEKMGLGISDLFCVGGSDVIGLNYITCWWRQIF
jgi:hypothetical protein